MASFLRNASQCEELIRLWELQLQVEEALQKTLTPVSPDIAQSEGRPYFKIPLPGKKHSDFFSFLLREQCELPLNIQKEQVPFLKYLHRQDKIKRKYHQEMEHDFIVGFPAFYYKNRFGQEKLSALFKFPLLKIEYPKTFDSIASGPQASFITDTIELWQSDIAEDEVGLTYWIDEFFLQEELEVADDEILAFRKEAAEKSYSSSDLLIAFCRKICKADSIGAQDDTVFDHIVRSLSAHLRTIENHSRNRQAVAVYPYSLVYKLEENQPTRQLQVELNSIVDRGLIERLPPKHPAKLYLFGNNEEEGYARSIAGQYLNSPLTKSQYNAIKVVRKRKLSTINGPPGTGKTHTIRNIAADRFVRYVADIASPDHVAADLHDLTLVASTNNRAVDNALEGMEIDDLLPVSIRMGSRIVMSRTTVDFLKLYCKKLSKMREHISLREFYSLKKKLKDALKKSKNGRMDTPQIYYDAYLLARKVLNAWAGANRDKLLKLLRTIILDIEEKRGIKSLKRKKNLYLFASAFPLVGSTLLSLRNLFPLEASSIGMVIIDEAGQCQPSYILPALVRARQAAMIGDVLQLEPIAKLRMDDIETLSRKRNVDIDPDSLRFFTASAEVPRSSQHIAITACHAIHELKEHFRCQPPIIRVCMQLCGYDLDVKTKTTRTFDSHLFYKDVQGNERRCGGSWANDAEAGELFKIVGMLHNFGVKYGEMAVLTPYRGHLNVINQILAKNRLPFASGEIGFDKQNAITTGTIHRFQGGERRIVLFSHVIANGMPDFLNSRVNLLNVAVSRAQELFIFVGSLGNLSKGTYTALLKKHLEKYGQPFSRCRPPYTWQPANEERKKEAFNPSALKKNLDGKI